MTEDIDMMAFIAINAEGPKNRTKAKREMKRRFGYRATQEAITHLRHGLILLRG